MQILFVLVLFSFVSAKSTVAQEILLHEEFEALNMWEPLTFPKISRHSKYTSETNNGVTYLLAQGDSSASGVILKDEFSLYEYPKVCWRWKVDSVIDGADGREKSGDDYPIRIYAVFKYDPSAASLWEAAKYKTAKLIYGEYPPHSSLNYVWSNIDIPEERFPSPYTDRAIIVPVNSGEEGVGQWQEHCRDVLQDYKSAFDEDPPQNGSIAIMTDSDNTESKTKAYVDWIRVSK